MHQVIQLGECLYTLVGAAVVAFGIWRAWRRPRSVPEVGDLAAQHQPGWSVRGELARLFLVPVDMSSVPAQPAAPADMEPVSIPVSLYGMAPGGMAAPAPAAPDMDAANADMPRISRDITSDELIVLLAVLRGPDQKPRFSANAIHALVGGDRNTVMAKVKEIRTGPAAPVFPPRTPEQTAARVELQLDR